MSTHFKMWNSLIDAPDPDDYRLLESVPGSVGKFSNGFPVIQGREGGELVWGVMTIADYHDIYSRWNTNKATRGTFVVPPHTTGNDWDTWRSVTAYCDPPTCEYRGNQIFNVRVVIHEATTDA